ncbi:MAG: hypothetical protein DRJ42_23330 [Deltaproteobacteria bacterium]|nr:MAG: hypothetical protein DRJ42_23330 [Deltaproteobacteria bacterium]
MHAAAIDIVPGLLPAPGTPAVGAWYGMSKKVKPIRRRSRDRANPLDMQVSEIRNLIGRLRTNDEARSPLVDRSRSVAPLARSNSSRPARALPRALATPLPRGAERGAVAPSDDRIAAVEALLGPICERLEGLIEKFDARLDGPTSGGAGGSAALAANCALRGRITESLLPDLLQMVTSNRWTGVFVLNNETLECRLYFDDGQACHAEAPDVTGEGAFFVALALEEGEYAFMETPAHPEKTINSNTQFLILEALRQIDEAKGG